MTKNFIKQGLCLSLSLLLLLTGCGSDKPDGLEAAEAGAFNGESVSADSGGPESAPSQGSLTVSYIDVGQGDSTLIELPDKKTVLIDAGEAEYGQTVIDYIESRGIEKLDYVVATHPHSDHIGGLPDVINRFEVGAVYMPKVQNNTKIFQKLLTAIQDKGLKINTAKNGVSLLSSEGLSADFIAPNGDSYSDLNNYSAVLRLEYGETSFLFTGDAEKKSEDEILAHTGAGSLHADVLKVGHHGSAYSTSDEFLTAVSPSYAVISCGAGNKYGHPESVILDRLNRFGVSVFRTDLLGTIVFTSDGKKITVDKKASTAKENAPPNAQNDPAHTPAQSPSQPTAPVQSPAQSQTPSSAQPQSPSQSQTQTSAQSPEPSQTKPPAQSQTQPAPAEQPAPPAAASPSPDVGTTVYITATGSKYHRDGCQYLSKSKIPISLAEAKANYEPCSKCNPPQ